MRKAVLVVVMIVGITLLVWAGVHNARERKQAAQQAAQPKVMLGTEANAKASTDEDSPLVPKLQGKKAPSFTLVDLNGKKVSLADYKGKPVLVNFWATYCEPCKLEMPWLEEFSKKYAADGLIILGISNDDETLPKSVIANTAKKLGATYPILLANDKVQEEYDIQADPESFFVDKSGTVLVATAGIYDGQGGKDLIESHIKKIIAAGGR